MSHSPTPREPRPRRARARLFLPLLGVAAGGALFALAAQTAQAPTPWTLEAEQARGQDDRPLPSGTGGGPGWIVPDPDASGGRAVMLASGGGEVQVVLPADVPEGTYAVNVRARGEAFQGWPALELRVDGKAVGTVTVGSATYATQTFGAFALRPGQRLEVVFVNDAYGGAPGKDRNVYVDRLDLQPPAPVAAAPAREVLDVKTLGATGDGVTDDSAALARIGDAGGKDIYFPPGTYLLRRPVELRGLKDQTVYGSGATLREADDFVPGGDAAPGMLTLTGAQGLTVRDLTLVGRPDYDVSISERRVDGLHVRGSRGVRIAGLKVERTHTNAIHVDKSDDVTVEDNNVNGAYASGIQTNLSNNVRVLRNTVTGLGDPAKFKSIPGIGIFGYGGDTFLAEGNVLRNLSNTATKTEGINNTTFRGNTVDIFGKDGIKVMPRPGFTTSVANAVVEGNTIRDRYPWASDGTSYILFHSVQGGRIAGNRVESTYRPPTPYEEDAIRVNTWGGGQPSRDILIENNEASGTRRGVRLEADGTVFRGNTVRGGGAWARSGVIVSANGITVANNTFDGPAIGVLLNRGVARTRVENNRFANNSGAGVYADNNNSGTTVKGNSFGIGVAQSVVGQVGSCGGECR